jgi:hypothetical protein
MRGTSWCLLIQGEEIKYSQDNRRLYVIDADGDRCKLDILKQEKRTSPLGLPAAPQAIVWPVAIQCTLSVTIFAKLRSFELILRRARCAACWLTSK